MTKQTDSYPANFKPNFTSAFSVTVPQPLAAAFSVLGTTAGLERSILLSPMASAFEPLAKDAVAVEGKLEDAFLRTAPAGSGEGLPRQSFKFTETVKMVPRLAFLDVIVNLQGTLTWDEERHVVLYETVADMVTVRKVRWFEAMDGPGGPATKVSETIEGQCPALLQFITQRTTRSAHQEQMNLYATLFE
ncbi:hypothetical protein B0H17DRAFT_458483 [Mycena rosella]|uniref:Uncharacterized protein n=1 Tax=Mycena rosella TaxID=1033263 RepID=A0AAD7CER6_MYCRO|nr:hypothetical protein B0H17DRAFT_458483 [Mycena rosella]